MVLQCCMKERLPKEVRLNGTSSSGADDDRNDRVLLRYTDTNSGSILLTVTLAGSPPQKKQMPGINTGHRYFS